MTSTGTADDFAKLLERFYADADVDGREVATRIIGMIEEIAPAENDDELSYEILPRR